MPAIFLWISINRVVKLNDIRHNNFGIFFFSVCLFVYFFFVSIFCTQRTHVRFYCVCVKEWNEVKVNEESAINQSCSCSCSCSIEKTEEEKKNLQSLKSFARRYIDNHQTVNSKTKKKIIIVVVID